MSENKDKHRIHVETGRAANEEASQQEDPQTETGADPAGAAADKISRLQAEKDELLQTLVRRQADFENYRKRIERDRQEEHRRVVAKVIEDLLQVLDALERAAKAYEDPKHEEYRKGVELIHRQLWEIMARHGLERIEAAGKMFDPHFHQAIERVESTQHPDGAIVEVLHDGYLYHGRVLRPSLVRVAVHGGEEQSAAERG